MGSLSAPIVVVFWLGYDLVIFRTRTQVFFLGEIQEINIEREDVISAKISETRSMWIDAAMCCIDPETKELFEDEDAPSVSIYAAKSHIEFVLVPGKHYQDLNDEIGTVRLLPEFWDVCEERGYDFRLRNEEKYVLEWTRHEELSGTSVAEQALGESSGSTSSEEESDEEATEYQEAILQTDIDRRGRATRYLVRTRTGSENWIPAREVSEKLIAEYQCHLSSRDGRTRRAAPNSTRTTDFDYDSE